MSKSAGPSHGHPDSRAALPSPKSITNRKRAVASCIYQRTSRPPSPPPPAKHFDHPLSPSVPAPRKLDGLFHQHSTTAWRTVSTNHFSCLLRESDERRRETKRERGALPYVITLLRCWGWQTSVFLILHHHFHLQQRRKYKVIVGNVGVLQYAYQHCAVPVNRQGIVHLPAKSSSSSTGSQTTTTTATTYDRDCDCDDSAKQMIPNGIPKCTRMAPTCTSPKRVHANESRSVSRSV